MNLACYIIYLIDITIGGFATRGIEAHIESANRREAREREFTKLYRESYPIVYNYVRCRMGGDDAAEDIVSEAYMQAARHFDRFDPTRAKFSTWVTTIATNAMISHWRKGKPVSTLDEVPEKVFAQPAAQDELDDRDLVDRLLAVLDGLERRLVIMKYREGYRNVDIAAALGMNASTVATKLANALAKMRAEAEKSL